MPTSEKSDRLWKDLLMGVMVLTAVVIVEAGLLRILHALPRGEIFHTFEEKKNTARETRGYDTLFFGDSSALYGLVPELFTERTGLSSYNFGTYAPASGFANVSLLREYLARHEPPKLIVLMLNVRYLAEKPSLAMFREYFYAPDLQDELYDVDPSFWYDPRRVLETVLPSYRNRERIMTSLKMAWQQKETPALHMGYLRSDERLENASEKLHELLALTEESSKIWEPQVVLLKMFCELAQSNSIPVFIKLGPIAQSAYTEKVTSYAGTSVEYIRETLEPYPTCFIDPDISFYRDDVMQNITHTNHTGALVLTQDTIEAIQKYYERED